MEFDKVSPSAKQSRCRLNAFSLANWTASSLNARLSSIQSRILLLLALHCRDWRTIYTLLVVDWICAMPNRNNGLAWPVREQIYKTTMRL